MPPGRRDLRMDGRVVSLLLLIGGVAVVLGASLVGSGDLAQRLAEPPPLMRAFLIGLTSVGGVALLSASVARFQSAGATPGHLAEADPIVLLRGIRLAFLSLAAFAAAFGWLLANPVPLVVAGIIAAVDIVETSFLLLVVGPLRGRNDRAGPPTD
jgi:hypothetical protein